VRKVTFILATGAEKTVEALPGLTVMEAAVQNGVDEIAGECGGVCACATCHVWIDQALYDVLGSPKDFEDDMLGGLPNRKPTSRLCCQINASDLKNDVVMHVPAAVAW
jgi:2Fe-2S ferredoxin